MKRPWQGRRHTIIVDFSRGSINMAAAESAGEAVRFRGITQIRLLELEDDGQELNEAEIAHLIGAEVKRRGWQGMRAACLLSRASTSTQSFLFPSMPDADLRQAIALKLDDTLHFALDDATFDFRRVRERKVAGVPQVLTLVAAARKDAVARAVDIMRNAGLKPVGVSAASESLANLTFYASPCDAEDATVHVDIGLESTILNLFEGRLLRFSREIEMAGDSFTRALTRPIITEGGPVHLTHAQAVDVLAVSGYPQEDHDKELPYRIRSSDVLPLVEPVAQRLTTEISQSANYLAGILGRPHIDYVVLSGTGTQLRGLDAQLEANLDVPVVSIDPVGRALAHWRLAICDETPSSPASFSAILGYSLGANRPINLMPRERNVVLRGATTAQVRKALTPPALALGASLSLAAIPIQQRFNTTYDQMRTTSERLDLHLSREDDPGLRLEQARDTAQRVAQERGIVPCWTGILKELSAALPAAAHLVTLDEVRQEGASFIQLVAEIERGPTSFDEIVTDLTIALSGSPFFRSVRVVSASSPNDEDPGEIELSLEVAGHGRAWEAPR